MYYLYLKTKKDGNQSTSDYERITHSKTIKGLFHCKHARKFLKSRVLNDKTLNRISVFAISDGNGENCNDFCLLNV